MNEIEKLIAELCPNGVEWRELGEVCSVNKGKQLNKKLLTEDGFYPAYNGGKNYSGRTNNYNVEANTIIVSQGGASAGFVNFVETKFWANAHCYYLIPDETQITNRFLYHFVKMNQSYLMDFQYGAGIPALKSDKLTKMLLPIPPLKIQKKIVQILDKFTNYVTELTSELTSELTLRQKQYSFYRDKLLSFEDEVYQVEWKTLGELLEKGRGTKITASQMKLLHKEGAPVRIFAGGKTYADVFFEDIPEKDIHQEAEIIVKSRGIIDFEYYAQPFSFKNEFWSYKPKVQNINLRYVFHYLKHNKIHFQNIANNMQMPQISSKDTEKYKIPVPSLEIQTRIVQVLDNFDTVCNDLNIGLPKEIELRQKQYEHFRDNLLTFTAEGVYTDSTVQYRQDIIRLLQWVFGPIRVRLGTICTFTRGNGLQKKDFTETGYPVIHYGQIYTHYGFSAKQTISYTSEAVFSKLKKAQTHDIIMATTSENVADVGKTLVWEGDEEIGISGDSYIIKTNQNARFLNYYFKSIHFQIQKEKKITGTKVIRINSKDMQNFNIVLPALDDQFSIVSTLDKFDTLTADLSQGLPKEIELRQKQYEYFRDKLLKFN